MKLNCTHDDSSPCYPYYIHSNYESRPFSSGTQYIELFIYHRLLMGGKKTLQSNLVLYLICLHKYVFIRTILIASINFSIEHYYVRK